MLFNIILQFLMEIYWRIPSELENMQSPALLPTSEQENKGLMPTYKTSAWTGNDAYLW